MDESNNTGFVSIESIYYALTTPSTALEQEYLLANHILALSDLIESILMFDTIAYDKMDCKMDKDVLQYITEYDLKSLFLPTDVSAIATDHVITLFAHPEEADSDDAWLTHQLINQQSISSFSEIEELWLQWFRDPKFRTQDLQDSLYKHLIKTVALDTLVAQEPQITDFLDTVLPPLELDFGGIDAYELWVMSKRGLLPREIQPTIKFVFLTIFQGLVEAAFAAAWRKGAAFHPHSTYSSLLLRTPLFAPASKIIFRRLTKEKLTSTSIVNDYIFSHTNRTIQVPLLLNYIASKAKSMKELFDITLDLRDKKEFIRFRKWINRLDYTLQQGNDKDAAKMITEVNSYINSLSELTKDPPKIEMQLSFPPALIFEVNQELLNRKNHLLFLKRVYDESKHNLTVLEHLKTLFFRSS